MALIYPTREHISCDGVWFQSHLNSELPKFFFFVQAELESDGPVQRHGDFPVLSLSHGNTEVP